MNEYGSIYGTTEMSKEEFEKRINEIFNEKAAPCVALDTVILDSLTSKKMITLNSLLSNLKFIGRYGNTSVIDVERSQKTLSFKQKPDELIHLSTEKIETGIVDSVIHSSVYAAGLSI